MLLAEALTLRSDLQKRLDSLDDRIKTNATHQEGEAPAEDPNELLEEADGLFDELETLIAEINTRNLATEIEIDGETLTLTEALARRDILTKQHKMLSNAAAVASSGGRDRFGYGRTRASELRTETSLDVKELRNVIDTIAVDIRNLDVQIQRKNWEVEL